MSTEQKAKITKDHIGPTAWERQRVVKPGAREAYMSATKGLPHPTFFLAVNFSEESGIKPKNYSISTLIKELSADLAERIDTRPSSDVLLPSAKEVRAIVERLASKALKGVVTVAAYVGFPMSGQDHVGVVNITYVMYPENSPHADELFEAGLLFRRSGLFNISFPDRYLADPESLFGPKAAKSLRMKSVGLSKSDTLLPINELLSLEDVRSEKAARAATKCLDELMTGIINVRESFVSLCAILHEMDETAVVVAGDPLQKGFSVRAERQCTMVEDDFIPTVRVTLTRTEIGEGRAHTSSSHSKSVTETHHFRTGSVSGVECAAYAEAVLALFKADMDEWDLVK